MLSKQLIEEVVRQVKPIIKKEVNEYAFVVLDSFWGDGQPAFEDAIRYRVTDNYDPRYLERALSKAYFTWRTGLPSGMGKHFPDLTFPGDNTDRGSVSVGNIIVSLVARIDPERVEAMAYKIAVMLHDETRFVD